MPHSPRRSPLLFRLLLGSLALACAFLALSRTARAAEADEGLPPDVARMHAWFMGEENRPRLWALWKETFRRLGYEPPQASLRSFPVAEIVRLVHPEGAPRPTAGVWVHAMQSVEYPQLPRINVLLAVQENGEIASGLLLPGETLADPTLQHDAVDKLVMLLRLQPRTAQCAEYPVVKTEVPGQNRTPESTQPWSEVWTVRACGVLTRARIDFRPDDKGETDFFVKLVAEP